MSDSGFRFNLGYFYPKKCLMPQTECSDTLAQRLHLRPPPPLPSQVSRKQIAHSGILLFFCTTSQLSAQKKRSFLLCSPFDGNTPRAFSFIIYVFCLGSLTTCCWGSQLTARATRKGSSNQNTRSRETPAGPANISGGNQSRILSNWFIWWNRWNRSCSVAWIRRLF